MDRLVRLFLLKRWEYLLDFYVTPPLTLALAYASLRQGFGFSWLLLLVAGFVSWTFYEYALHRWLLHRTYFWTKVHDLHHDDPRAYVAVPPWMTFSLYAILWLTFGLRSSAFAVGFSVGYIAYAALHTLYHFRTTRPGDWLFARHRRHALHHLHEDKNFGVTVDWWDRLLGTEHG